MPNLQNWLATPMDTTDEGTRAVRAWLHILDWPTPITLYRSGVALSEQTVRIEYNEASTSSERQGVAGQPSERQLIIFGVRNHPTATVLDTNIQRGDLLKFQGDTYKIIDVILKRGGLEAYTERLQSGG